MLSNLFYYGFYTSIVLIYGVGIERETYFVNKRKNILLKALKMLLCVSSTTAVTWLLTNGLLISVNLSELFPFFAVLIFIVISVFVESVIRITAKISASEFGISMLFVLISINESISLAESVVNSCICIFSFFMFVPLLYSLNFRLELSERKFEHEKISYILMTMAVISFVFLCWNVSWLNKGVF